MDTLTEKNEGFCETTGLYGILIGVTCLAQFLYVMIPHWISYSILGVYALTITGFILLSKKSTLAYPLLFTCGVLLLLQEAFLMIALTYSLVLLLLLFYTFILLVYLEITGIRKRLVEHHRAIAQEQLVWEQQLSAESLPDESSEPRV
jgi:hypothetical protein